MESKVTIMITGRTKNAQLVSQNLELIKQLNPNTEYKSLVVDNSIDETGLIEELKPYPEVKIVPGPAPIPGIPANNVGSYRHAQALNTGIANVHTRYLIVVDPDMFVVRKNWINDVIEQMQRGDFAFLGAPWHPRWYPKYRGFPCAQFFAVDLAKIPKTDLDFTPGMLTYPHWIIPLFGAGAMEKYNVRPDSKLYHRDLTPISKWLYGLYAVLFKSLLLFRPFIAPHEHRFRIGTSRDTGTLIWQKFFNHPKYNVSLLHPIIDPLTHFPQFKHMRYPLGIFLETILPRFFRMPWDSHQWNNLRELNYLDFKVARDLGLEGFTWMGAPFSFHLRGNHKETMGKDISQISILGHLKNLIKIPYHEIHKVVSSIN